jgi:hypothetical protein
MESPEIDGAVFPPFPQALEIKKRFPHYHRHDEYEQ